jgi:hypothetical protein
MFDWIPYLWELQGDWGSTWLIGAAIGWCIGLVAMGATAVVTDGNYNQFEWLWGIGLLSAAIPTFWPVVAIALPFVTVAGGLFVAGVYIALRVKEALESRSKEVEHEPTSG